MAPSTFLCGTVGKPRLFGNHIKKTSGETAPAPPSVDLTPSGVVAIQAVLSRQRRGTGSFSVESGYESPDASGTFFECS